MKEALPKRWLKQPNTCIDKMQYYERISLRNLTRWASLD